MRKFLLLLSVVILLTGCSTINSPKSPVRNREFDYLYQPVQATDGLKTPKNLATPDFKPYTYIPKGNDNYQPQKNVVLTPPDFNQSAPVDETATTAKAPRAKPVTEESVKATLSFDKENAGLLTIEAPFADAWKLLARALTASEIEILSANKKDYYYKVAVDNAGRKETYLIYVIAKANSVAVSVFTDTGILSKSQVAVSILREIKGNL